MPLGVGKRRTSTCVKLVPVKSRNHLCPKIGKSAFSRLRLKGSYQCEVTYGNSPLFPYLCHAGISTAHRYGSLAKLSLSSGTISTGPSSGGLSGCGIRTAPKGSASSTEGRAAVRGTPGIPTGPGDLSGGMALSCSCKSKTCSLVGRMLRELVAEVKPSAVTVTRYSPAAILLTR